MRKKEKEVFDVSVMESLVRSAETMRLAFCDGEEPYIVPVCFGYHDGSIFFHSAKEGRKLELIRRSNKVCFEVDTYKIDELVPGDCLLACTDGVWHYFSDDEMASAVDSLPPREACEFLIDKARGRARGKGDNLSMVIVKLESLPAATNSRMTPLSTTRGGFSRR